MRRLIENKEFLPTGRVWWAKKFILQALAPHLRDSPHKFWISQDFLSSLYFSWRQRNEFQHDLNRSQLYVGKFLIKNMQIRKRKKEYWVFLFIYWSITRILHSLTIKDSGISKPVHAFGQVPKNGPLFEFYILIS